MCLTNIKQSDRQSSSSSITHFLFSEACGLFQEVVVGSMGGMDGRGVGHDSNKLAVYGMMSQEGAGEI